MPAPLTVETLLCRFAAAQAKLAYENTHLTTDAMTFVRAGEVRDLVKEALEKHGPVNFDGVVVSLHGQPIPEKIKDAGLVRLPADFSKRLKAAESHDDYGDDYYHLT